MYCTKCAAVLGSTDLFCSNCGTRVKSPDASDDIQIISPPRALSLPSTQSSASMPSVRVSSSYMPSSTSSLTSEVCAQKLATTKQDCANNKDILQQSYFVIPQSLWSSDREIGRADYGQAPYRRWGTSVPNQ